MAGRASYSKNNLTTSQSPRQPQPLIKAVYRIEDPDLDSFH